MVAFEAGFGSHVPNPFLGMGIEIGGGHAGFDELGNFFKDCGDDFGGLSHNLDFPLRFDFDAATLLFQSGELGALTGGLRRAGSGE